MNNFNNSVSGEGVVAATNTEIINELVEDFKGCNLKRHIRTNFKSYIEWLRMHPSHNGSFKYNRDYFEEWGKYIFNYHYMILRPAIEYYIFNEKEFKYAEDEIFDMLAPLAKKLGVGIVINHEQCEVIVIDSGE